jgi:hypothetical protein
MASHSFTFVLEYAVSFGSAAYLLPYYRVLISPPTVIGRTLFGDGYSCQRPRSAKRVPSTDHFCSQRTMKEVSHGQAQSSSKFCVIGFSSAVLDEVRDLAWRFTVF